MSDKSMAQLDAEISAASKRCDEAAWQMMHNRPEASSVSHPTHYTSHPSGVECKDIIQWMPYNIGAAMKYLWRCDAKHPDPIEDLEKAVQYIQFEIERRKGMKT